MWLRLFSAVAVLSCILIAGCGEKDEPISTEGKTADQQMEVPKDGSGSMTKPRPGTGPG